jgi:hypothetical protein
VGGTEGRGARAFEAKARRGHPPGRGSRCPGGPGAGARFVRQCHRANSLLLSAEALPASLDADVQAVKAPGKKKETVNHAHPCRRKY